FDLDGTILDSEQMWKKATILALESRGIFLDAETAKALKRQLRGLGLIEFAKVMKSKFNLTAKPQEFISEQNRLSKELYEKEIKFIDGFTDFYKKVEKRKLKIGIATNADKKTVDLAKNKFNLETFFGSHIYCIEDVNNICKPEPDLFLHAAKKLDVPPAQCVVIEDSACGITAAKKAGMFCIGINTAKDKESLYQADLIVDHYHEINLDTLII
ncbi:HAD family hydrolase, partial [Candidatus Dependentiae bacterium]